MGINRMTQDILDLEVVDVAVPSHPDLQGAVVNMPQSEPVMADAVAVVDVREGLPSASSLARLVACPGSWGMERGLPDFSGEAAERGSRIHAWLEWDIRGCIGDEPVLVDEEEYEAAMDCRRVLAETARSVLGFAGYGLFMAEERLWLRDEMIGDRLMSGAADVVFVSEDGRGYLIADYKTGRVAAEPEECNKQVMALAVMLADYLEDKGLGYDVIYGVIVQPLVSHAPQCVAYRSEDVAGARAYIEGALWAATASISEAKLVPSAGACNYCRAKLICPALRGEVVACTESAVDRVCWESLDAQGKLRAYDLACLAEKWGATVKAKCRDDLEAGLAIDGLQLKEGNKVRSVTDVEGAYQLLADVLPADAFVRACSVKISSLEKEYCNVEQARDEANGAKKRTQAVLRAELASRLDACIGMKQNRASVERSRV